MIDDRAAERHSLSMPIDLAALLALIPERAGTIVIALAIDAILGGLLARIGWIGPDRWVASITSGLDRRLNREHRSERARAIRGGIAILVIVVFALGAGLLVDRLAAGLDIVGFVSIVLLALALGQRRLLGPVTRASIFLSIGQAHEASAALAPVMGRDTRPLDPHGLARAAIEATAERQAFGVVAPVCWFIVFGLPGLFVQRAVDTADQLIGFRTMRHAAFGLVTARLNDGLGLVPALIAAILTIVAAVFVPRGKPLAAFAALVRDPWRAPGRAALWPEASYAGALGLALGGPRHYGTNETFAPWVNANGRARAEATDMRRALYLFMLSSLLLAGLAALIGMAAAS